MNLRLVVGGLLTRDPVLGTLLLNYADRLEHGGRGSDTTPPSFIVPDWVADFRSTAAPESELFTVEVHTSRGDPRRGHNLDVILDLLDEVLTQPATAEPITARRLDTCSEIRDSCSTAFRTGMWAIASAAEPVGTSDDGGVPPLELGSSRR